MKIMIVGGTSGIGLALAAHYVQQGADLALCGRDITRLHGHALCADPRVRTYEFDIADRAALTYAVDDFGTGGLDILIVTAGRYANAASGARPESGLGVMQTNVLGLAQALEVAGALMQRQGYGQLVPVASVAGLLRDYPAGHCTVPANVLPSGSATPTARHCCLSESPSRQSCRAM